MLGNTTSTDEGILKLMGEEAVDTFSAGWYAASLDTADNKKFVAGINADLSTRSRFLHRRSLHGASLWHRSMG